MSRRDEVLLQDMLDAARRAADAIQGHAIGDLACDTIWMLGLVKCIEIAGEAAGRLSVALRDRYPETPWHLIIGMRHRLVHGYFEIDHEQLWGALTEDLPLLIPQLERMLADESTLCSETTETGR